MRSRVGRQAARGGASSAMAWRVEFATNLANRRHQSNVAKGKDSQHQPVRVSRNALPGWLIHTSVTSWRDRKGCSARSVSSSAEASACGAPATSGMTRLSCGCGSFKFIHRPEVEVPCDQHLNAIAVLLFDGRRDVHRALEYLCGNVLRGGRAIDDRAAAPLRCRGALNGAVDQCDEDSGAETFEKMAIDATREPCSPTFIRSRGSERNADAACGSPPPPTPETPAR